MRAEGTEETTGLAVQQSASQNRHLEAFMVFRPGSAIDSVLLANEGFY
jgi:hypothetical protein